MIERTLVLVKPDGVRRALIGKVISRFEDAGLKVVALKLTLPDKKLAGMHYPLDKEWYTNAWKNTKKGYDEKGLKMDETPLQLGERIRGWLMESLTGGPVVAMVVEGNDAIAAVRKIAGATAPNRADPSSIRGMYSTDSYDFSDSKKRVLRNIVHASDSTPTAEREIGVWFSSKDIASYKRSDEDVIY
ncbi:nucleoside-diphosphate kinase [Candidatus Marsarchaeota archaeon]|jgi:nucleoside-diphosphate kinase|nr:nucleoside-diphosphate kinase [Candidatus Marsarchaeota archaeon]MCL5099757.1 nucleoside-diphosphate kinase [Candidatus Marsarchaeota archaeon]